MTKLIPIKVDENTIIYVESTDEVGVSIKREPTSDDRVSKGGVTGKIIQNFQELENTIRTFTTYTLDALRNLANANVEEVTLEFGVEFGGEAGIPYITKGTAKTNLNVKVKCTFPK